MESEQSGYTYLVARLRPNWKNAVSQNRSKKQSANTKSPCWKHGRNWRLNVQPHQTNNKIRRSEMSSFLESQSWDLFSTYTFAERFNFKSARRAIERHYERMKSELRCSFPFFYVIEPHSHYDVSGTHIHGLIGDPVGDILGSVKIMWNDWKEHKGHGRAEFEEYIENQGASYYLTKYLVKSEFDSSYWNIYLPE